MSCASLKYRKNVLQQDGGCGVLTLWVLQGAMDEAGVYYTGFLLHDCRPFCMLRSKVRTILGSAQVCYQLFLPLRRWKYDHGIAEMKPTSKKCFEKGVSFVSVEDAAGRVGDSTVIVMQRKIDLDNVDRLGVIEVLAATVQSQLDSKLWAKALRTLFEQC